MTTFNVEASIGTISATVEADTADNAIAEAINDWITDPIETFAAATFEVREVEAA